MAKLYIIVNSDLHLSKGQSAAQVSHVTQLVVDTIIRAGYESHPVPSYYINYMLWQKNPVTIIKKADTKILIDLAICKDTVHFYDNVYNKRSGLYVDNITAVAFYPTDQTIEIIEKLVLL